MVIYLKCMHIFNTHNIYKGLFVIIFMKLKKLSIEDIAGLSKKDLIKNYMELDHLFFRLSVLIKKILRSWERSIKLSYLNYILMFLCGILFSMIIGGLL